MEFQLLRPNHSCSVPSNLLFFDTETLCPKNQRESELEEHSLRLGVAIACRLEHGRVTRRKVCRFTTAEQFWSFVNERTHPRLPLWIFAHNLGFDATIVNTWSLLDCGDLCLVNPMAKHDKKGNPRVFSKGAFGFVCDDDPPTIFTLFTRDGCKISCVDTLNYWRVALSVLGEKMGLKKMRMPKWDDSEERWFRYCTRDVEVIEKSILELLRWIKENDYGMFRMSAPSQAMSAFRHRWLKHRIELHMWKPARSEERRGYYGGRLQLFYQGRVKSPVFEFDITSQYPFVLRRHDFPRRLAECVSDAVGRGIDKLSFPEECIATVALDTETADFPKRTREGTVYPVGRFVTTLVGPELVRAYQTNSIKKLISYTRYQLAPLFHEFVEHFFAKRLEAQERGDQVSADFCKLIMNSFYGKWGQMLQEWTDQGPAVKEIDADGEVYFKVKKNELRQYRVLANRLQVRQPAQEHPRSFPAIAAFCTAYARDYIREIMDVAGRHNIYYCVTDAVFTNTEGKERLDAAGYIHNSEIGKLRCKHSADSGLFQSLHCYQVGNHRLEGSRKKNAKRVAHNTYQQQQFEGLRSVLKRPSKATIRITKVLKRFGFNYHRGRILPDGSIEPLRLEEW